MLHRHAVDEHPVEGAVACFQGRTFRAGEPAEGVFQRRRGKAGIQFGEGVAQPSLQDHIPVLIALDAGSVGGNVRAVSHLPAEGAKPV